MQAAFVIRNPCTATSTTSCATSAAIDDERVEDVESILEFALWGLLFEDLRLASRALAALAPHDGVWAVRAARLADTCATLHRSILAKSATVHALRGNLVEARRQLRRFDRVDGEIPAPWLRALREEQALAEAMMLVERFDNHEPEMEWPEVEASDDLWPITALLRARLALLERSPMRALEIVEFAETTHPGWNSVFAEDVIAAMKAHALLQLSEPDRARDVLAQAPQGPLVVLATAHLQMFVGDADAARELATAVLDRSTSSLAERAEALLVRIWADAVLGRMPTAREGGIVGRMVVAAGLVRIIAHMPGWLMDQMVDLSERGVRPAFEAAVDKASAALVITERPQLTPRETVVLKALERHGSVSDMAKALSVSPSTVKTQLSAIYRKLGVSSRHHAVPAAYRLGLLERASNPG